MKQVVVLVGAGSIGIAIARRVSAGKRLVIADYSFENAKQAAQMLDNAGFECTPVEADLGSKESILGLVNMTTALGEVVNLINAAGVSPSQAPVERILQVDLYGTSVLLDEFGKVIVFHRRVDIDYLLYLKNRTRLLLLLPVTNSWSCHSSKR